MAKVKKVKKVPPKKKVVLKLVTVVRRTNTGKTYKVKAYRTGTRTDRIYGYRYNRYRMKDGSIFHVKMN